MFFPGALLITLLYLIFVVAIVALSFFMVTRLDEYSLDPEFTKPLLIIYVAVTVVLLVINIALYFALPLDTLFATLPSYY